MIDIFIVDDHILMREGLKQILEDESDLRVCGEVGTGREALDHIPTVKCDVVVLDLSLPDCSGIEVLQSIRHLPTPPPVLILTMHDKRQYGPRLLRMGAAAFLTKKTAAQKLVTAIRRIAQGGRYITPKLAELFMEQRDVSAARPRHEILSGREFEVLCLIASGHTAAEIAATLSITSQTVSTHRAHILAKMGMRSTADLVQYAIWHRLVPWSPEATLLQCPAC
jgi:two-component system invasion response regulator UvrY